MNEAHPLAFFDQRTFALATARKGAIPTAVRPGVRAILIPHHWFASDLIVHALRSLAASAEVGRVVVLGPNHLGTGGAAFSTSRLAWRVPGGVLRADVAAVDRMAASGLARVLPDVLSNEHSIAGLVPAVAAFFTRAVVVPIAVRARPTPAELARMSATLASLLEDPATVLVASVDFSHYRSAAEAAVRNEESIRAIKTFDIARVLGYGNEHMDSPATIAVLLEAMRLIEATRFEVWADTNSARLGGSMSAPNVTSYITGSFA